VWVHGGAGVPPAPAPPVVPAAPAWDGTFGVRAVSPVCHGNPDAPRPGDVLCFGDRDKPLDITVGGTPDAPITYSGDGSIEVPGVHAEADNVVIQGFVSDGADDTGIWAAGRNVTIQDNVITQVRYNGNDLDGIRFFGEGAKVLHNTVHDLEGSSDIGGSHVDCMQTFATSRPGSQDVVIQGNRCEGIRAQTLMAEGPGVQDGSGQGVSSNWVFRGNYCDSYADAQSVAFEDVQDVTVSQNDMVGRANKAFALGKDSTGIVVQDNTIGPGYGARSASTIRPPERVTRDRPRGDRTRPPITRSR
jgi:hypothetical protein